MDYFLNTTDTDYYHWQIELLIESFKVNNLDDNLFISLSNSNEPSRNENFLKNFLMHKKKNYFNFGQTKSCPQINKIYSLADSLARQSVNQPVCVIEPDMVIKTGIQDSSITTLYSSFMFSVDPYFTIEEAEKNVGPFFDWLNLDKKIFEEKWLPIGSSYVFNKFPIEFFYKVIEDAEKLSVFQMVENNKVWERTSDVSLVVNIINNISKIACVGDYQIVSPIDSGAQSYFISYKHGYLPAFHKSMFTYEPPANLSFGDPFTVLSNLSFSPNSIYTADVARRVIAKTQ